MVTIIEILVEHFVQNLKVFEQTIRKFGQKQETFCKITVSSVKITNSYLFILIKIMDICVV